MKPLFITTLLVLAVCIGCREKLAGDGAILKVVPDSSFTMHHYSGGTIYWNKKTNKWDTVVLQSKSWTYDTTPTRRTSAPPATAIGSIIDFKIDSDTLLDKKNKEKWLDASKATRPVQFTITPIPDTLPNKKIKNLEKMKPRWRK